MSSALAAPVQRPARAGWAPPALEVRGLADRDAFVTIEPEWSALAEASSAPPFCRHEWIRSHLDNFVPRAPLSVVTARNASGRLVAALPLVARPGSISGIGVRELAAPANVHSLRFDLLAEDPGRVAPALFAHLVDDPSWDVLKITDVAPAGSAWHVYQAAQAAGYPVGAWPAQRSPYIELPASFDELMRGCSAKFRANLRRRRKRLAEHGAIDVVRLAGTQVSEPQLEECFALERSGWKGRQGSAASQSAAIHGFHLGLLRAPALHARLSLTLLRLDGKPIAFHYGLTAHGVYSLLMTSYSEAFQEFSPGHLLTEAVLEDCISRGLREFDFLGCDLPWKLDWTRSVRPHHWLFIFRDSLRGRALWQLKFGWVRSARELLARWSMSLSHRRIPQSRPI